MSAGLCALSYNSCRSEFLHFQCVCNRCHDRDDLDSGSLPFLHVGSRRTGTRGDDFYTFLDNHISHFTCIRRRKHDIDTERFVREFTTFSDFIANGFCSEID